MANTNSNKTVKTVLITGASSGIGKACAEFFAARGWNVAATMRSPNQARFSQGKGTIRPLRLDVTDQSSIDTALSQSLDEFGRIDVLVNNAGYGLLGPFEAMSEEQLRRQFETNVFGLMAMTRAVLPHMRERRSGRIINVASIAGRMTLPLCTAYCSTKWAVEGFSEALSFELREHNIRVKLVEPGPIRTDFMSRSHEVATKNGLTAYDGFVSRVMPNMEAWMQNAPGPELVARSVWRAATDVFPRLRYSPNGAAVLAGRRFVPSWLYVRAVRRVLNAW